MAPPFWLINKNRSQKNNIIWLSETSVMNKVSVVQFLRCGLKFVDNEMETLHFKAKPE